MAEVLIRPGGVCVACARRCDLHVGPGRCGVRSLDEDGELVVGGEITHAAVQPVERKPIFHYRPGMLLLTVGSWGCGTRCLYCRNAEIALARRQPRRLDTTVANLAELAMERHADGVAFSYNEPLVRAEQVAAECTAAIDAGLEAAIVTSGWATEEVLDLLVPATTVWRIDLKAASERSAVRIFGESGTPWRSAFETIRYLSSAGRHVEVSLTYSRSIHDDRELALFGEAVGEAAGEETGLHLQPLLPAHRLRAIEAPRLPALLSARRVLRSTGLRHVYVHALGPPELRTTWCDCGAPLVERGVARVEVNLDAQAACAFCGGPTPIHLGERAGVAV